MLLVVCLAPIGCGAEELDGQTAHGAGEVLFVRHEQKAVAIYSMALDGTNVRRVVAGDQPRWSPDGKRFAYLVDEDDRAGVSRRALWIQEEDGTRRRLVGGAAGVEAFAWAPDGVRVAYSDGLGLSIVDTQEGTSERFITGAASGGSVDWSPTGEQLLVEGLFAGLSLLDVATREETIINDEPLAASSGRWSPDGTQIVYRMSSPLTRMPTRRTSVLILRETSGRETRLTEGSSDSDPAWTSDGKEIVFSRGPAWKVSGDILSSVEASAHKTEIYALNLATGAIRQLTRNNRLDRSPDVRPKAKALPDRPEPDQGEIVVPDLVGETVAFDDERRRFADLGLGLKRPSEARDAETRLMVIEQAPRGGTKVSAGTVVTIAGLDVSDPFSGRSFSRSVWKAHPRCEDEANPRARMYADLAERVLQEGMSRAAVNRLLGRPETADAEGADWPLGYASGFRIDCDYLRVEYDAGGRLASVTHWQS